jgi:hypothetical protein
MIFDDLVSDGNGKSAWTYVCNDHQPTVDKEFYGATELAPIECICGVEGCENQADFYFTFYANNHLVVSE